MPWVLLAKGDTRCDRALQQLEFCPDRRPDFTFIICVYDPLYVSEYVQTKMRTWETSVDILMQINKCKRKKEKKNITSSCYKHKSIRSVFSFSSSSYVTYHPYRMSPLLFASYIYVYFKCECSNLLV